MKKTILPVLARHKRLTAAVLALAVVLAAGGGAFALLHRKGGDAGDDLNYARTVTLTKGELTESVNVSGLVQSARVSSVTTSLTSKVVAVNVKVGDVVKKGDVICTLDDTDIRRAIQDKEKELSGEKQQLKDAVTKAADALSAAKRARDTERQTQDVRVNEATAQRDKAAAATQAALPAYNDARTHYDTMMKAVAPAESAAAAANAARQTAYDSWIAAGGAAEGDAYAAYQAAKEQARQADTALADARALYEFERYAGELERARQTYDEASARQVEAQSALEQAAAARTQALNACDQTVNSAIADLQQAEKQEKRGVADAALADLKKSLENTVLRAETDGKVTELKVNVGSICKGDVAVIQATDDLIVSVTIPEYAIQKVQVGLAASITSDASPTALRGKVSRISPTAGSSGEGGGTSAGFSADIAIQDPENIFIGAKAKAEIILNQKKDVYTVPLDAVQPDGDGMDVIQVRQPDGRFAPVRVQTGMKNDYAVEISGAQLTDGMEVLADASTLPDAEGGGTP